MMMVTSGYRYQLGEDVNRLIGNDNDPFRPVKISPKNGVDLKLGFNLGGRKSGR